MVPWAPAADGPPEGRPAGGGAEHTLPASYGSDRIVLMARDPYWAFAYWELTEGGRRSVDRRGRLILIRDRVLSDDVTRVGRVDVVLRPRAVDPLASDVVLKHAAGDAHHVICEPSGR